MASIPIYSCKRAVYRGSGEGGAAIDWERYEAVELTDTVTGKPVKERTSVQACWSPDWFHVRFICQDTHVVSRYQLRDEPLYEQDVVELFIDETGAGRKYIELEVSPHNVVFDARIQNDGMKSITAMDVKWDLAGLETTVTQDDEGHRIYDIAIPAVNFGILPRAGESWKVNFYRIDEDPQGLQEFQAWSPTGEVNYHIPSRFGKLVFEE